MKSAGLFQAGGRSLPLSGLFFKDAYKEPRAREWRGLLAT